MSKLPAFQFYPGDWRKDVGVQSLTYHDRGVWWEMLCLMHESERRGLLILNGKSMSEDALARLLGLDKQNLTTTITTLLTNGVASRDEETGALMCRRMVRDEKLREIRTQAGKRGGNPALLKQNPTTGDKQKQTPSSSFSFSKQILRQKADGGASEEACLKVYQSYPKKVGRKDALTAIGKACTRMIGGESDSPMSREQAVAFLVERVEAFARSPAGNNGTYTPHPATWFNGARYLDDPAEWAKQAGGAFSADRSNTLPLSARIQFTPNPGAMPA